MTIGERIRIRRARLGLTQAQVAELLNVSFQSVSSWERDEYLPESDKLVALARALRTGVGALMDEALPPAPDWELSDRLFSEHRMYTFVKASATACGMADTLRALPFARRAHEGQSRRGSQGIPYINHPLTMACHALAMGVTQDSVLAAILLHDVVEDCGVRLEELPVGEEVRGLVDRLTKQPPPGEDSQAYKPRYYARIMESPEAAFIKALDRCNNLSMMATGFTRDKMVTYIQETALYVLPLLDMLKRTQPQYSNAVFLIRYQMLSVMESLKRMLSQGG